jgi:hypothetical protein
VDPSPLGEVGQVRRWPAAGLGEEVVEAHAGGLVGAHVLGGEAVGLDEGGGGFADVAALGVGSGDVDVEAGLSLG